jgi:hypothetical protein
MAQIRMIKDGIGAPMIVADRPGTIAYWESRGWVVDPDTPPGTDPTDYLTAAELPDELVDVGAVVVAPGTPAAVGRVVAVTQATGGVMTQAGLIDPADLPISDDTQTALNARVAKGELVFNAADYGVTADGTTNDAPAIIAALAAMPATGGVLLLPDGTIRVGTAITVTKPIRITGAGPLATVLRAAAGFTGQMLTLNAWGACLENLTVRGDNGTGNASGVLVTASRCWLSNLSFEACVTGLAFTHATNLCHANKVKDVYLLNCTGVSVNIGTNAYDNMFQNLWIGQSGGAAGLYIGNDNCFFSNLHVWGCTSDGVQVRGNHNRIANAYIETNGGDGIDAFGKKDLLLANCYFWDNGAAGVNLQDMQHVGVSNCTFHNNTGPGINGGGTSNLVTVTGSRFYDDQATKTQPRPVTTTGTCDLWVLTGNVMRAADHLTGTKSLVGTGNISTGNLE